MIDGIRFKGTKYRHVQDDDLLDPMTKNTIILCQNPFIKNRIADIIRDICGGKCENEHEEVVDYWTNNEQIPSMRTQIDYLPTTRLIIDNEQIITLTIEVPFIFIAKGIQDIWLAEETEDNKISIYPMAVFKGSQEKWDEGIEAVYQHIASGRYGGYHGYWMPDGKVTEQQGLIDPFLNGVGI